MLKELGVANAELLKMDGLKSEIINSIINKITNPLNRIMGTLQNARKNGIFMCGEII